MAATLSGLRKLAKALGLTGYSKLRKAELERRIRAAQSGRREITATSEKPAPGAARANAPAQAVTPEAAAAPKTTPAAETTEEQIESAKYRLAPPGLAAPEQRIDRSLEEAIDQLPARRGSTLYLLPQKPGVLHAHWRLASGELARYPQLILRLTVVRDHALQILEDVPVRSEQGHWYFHVPAALDQAQAFLALGYERDGQFTSVIARGIARIPSLHAASRIDRSWWISDARFREMYLRAGGFSRDTKLGWDASISSR